MFGVKLVSENNKEFFKSESVRRDLVLLLIIFIDENVCSHIYVDPETTELWANFLSSEKSLQGKSRQKLIIPQAFGAEECSSYFIFNMEFVFKSISSICMLLGIFNISCSLSENGFRNAGM